MHSTVDTVRTKHVLDTHNKHGELNGLYTHSKHGRYLHVLYSTVDTQGHLSTVDDTQ